MPIEKTSFRILPRESDDLPVIGAINGVAVDPELIVIPNPLLADARMLDDVAIRAFEQVRIYSDELRPKAQPGSH
jgi:hypothetical protein